MKALSEIGDIMTEADLSQLLVFTLDEQRYALHLAAVVRTVRVVEFTPTPTTSEIVFGVVNVQGQIVPVVNSRKRCGLPERKMEPSDHLIIACSKRQTVALVVDEVQGVVEWDSEMIGSEEFFPSLDYVEGVAKLADGIVLILDLEKFVSVAEESARAFEQAPTMPQEEIARC
jgi:purine-binding chemotaxis protein CheW